MFLLCMFGLVVLGWGLNVFQGAKWREDENLPLSKRKPTFSTLYTSTKCRDEKITL